MDTRTLTCQPVALAKLSQVRPARRSPLCLIDAVNFRRLSMFHRTTRRILALLSPRFRLCDHRLRPIRDYTRVSCNL